MSKDKTKTQMSFDFKTLNNEQLKPVYDTEGGILVTAGAGSGKTRLLTHRIAYLISEKGVSPYNILAITFTNKAANEMKNRVEALLDGNSSVWISTFHSMCVSILRRHIDKLGYSLNFSIYGEPEKERAIKKIIADKKLDTELTKLINSVISSAKNDGLSPSEYYSINSFKSHASEVRDVFIAYQEELKKCNALDFDDLLTLTYKLLTTNDEVLEHYCNRFCYIHVDEFQDTNTIQYKIVRQLAKKHKNILVVGDEDQSIYGWRGANITNIQSFIKDFNSKIYKLEQNYRSTKKIIELSNSLIKHNTSRIEKTLWTDNKSGENVSFYTAQSEGDEAQYIISQIASLVSGGYYSFSDFAILMRINALSRPFEEKLIQYGVSHVVYGGFKFYERKEIKDILAYLKIISNPFDNDAIYRVINFPKRGIGDAAIAQLNNYSLFKGCSLFEAIMDCLNSNCDLPPAIIKKVQPFATVLEALKKEANKVKHSSLVKYLIRLLNLKEVFLEDTEENLNRKQNIKELVSSIEQFEAVNANATLDEYLQNVSLYSDLDNESSSEKSSVTLATVHSAKGLEFKVVFVVGLEDGLFPISRAIDSPNELEEERRLLYVAVTRAMERLYITYSSTRFLYGQRKPTIPSRFFEELGLGFTVPKSTYQEYNNEHRYFDNSYSKNTNSYHQKVTPSKQSLPKSNAAQTANDNVARRQDNVDVQKFKVGTKVKHRRFGMGEIVKLSGEGNNIYAEIEFETAGKLMLAISFAPLEVI